MNFLSMFGSSAAKKEREKELQHGDRILVEFGHDRVPLYINMFDIPRTAQLFIKAMGLPSLKRRIKLPDVAKFMYDDYLAWIEMTEDVAEETSWCNIILMAYTTKLLQDTFSHDKALLTMINKGEAVNYDHNLMFTPNDWNMLQLHIHARDTRDEAMRQVLGRLFKRSDGLMEFVGASPKHFTAIGLNWKALHEGTAVAKITAPDSDHSTKPSSTLDEEFHEITSNDLEDGTEYDGISIRSFSTICDDSVAGDADDLGGLDADDLDIDANLDMVNSIIAAVTQIDEDSAISETGAVNSKAGNKTGSTAIATEAEETTPVDTKAEDNVAVTTNAEDNTSLATEAKENIAANNDAEKITTVNSEVEENVAVTTKAADTAKGKSPDHTIWSPLAIRLHATGPSTLQDNDDAEFKAGFAPRRELPRTPPGSPRKNYQNTGVDMRIKPGSQVYQPPHRRPNTEATPSGWNGRTAPRNPRVVNKHPRGRGRQLPNLKYPKSVLNTLRAKQTVWPGDVDLDKPKDSGKRSTNWRRPKGPAVAED
ncbi:hypothetical protein GRF29_103g788539 [Pseudopithomyces chartarum]|uniref:Uncharacterized protein n=1 Tax=Pseudopithomyces chartarum TaxID=1892770 RepID=A0AAN6RFC0_9PLEO|nr:hypothetical protein GRF29_103g788539 [Pseudopithomyces chartarum]